MQEQFLTPKELSKLLPISVVTLKKWRKDGRGFTYSKLGRKIIYKVSDVNKWIEDHRV